MNDNHTDETHQLEDCNYSLDQETPDFMSDFMPTDKIYPNELPVPEDPPEDIWALSKDGLAHYKADPKVVIGKPPRYILRNAGDALQPQPPVQWLVDGLIQSGSVNMFFGAPGSKKTYTALSLGVAVASGKPWLGHITKQVPVLVIDEDNGEHRILKRIGEVLRGMGSGTETPIQSVSLAGFKLNKNEDVKEIRKLIVETGAKFVIVDVMAACMDGDENKKEFVQPIFNALRKLADETGIAILILHHSGKNGDYRGSSAILGAVDLMIEITSADNTDIVSFRTTKTRDVASGSFSAKAKWGIVSFKEAFTLETSDFMPVQKVGAGEEFAIRFLTTHPNSTQSDIKNNADTCAPITAIHGVQALVTAGRAFRTNPGEKFARYSLVKAPNTDG